MGECTLAIVGGGNMASAILAGCARSGDPELAPRRMVVAEPDGARRAGLAALGAEVVASAGELGRWLGPSTQVLLAVKPQSLASAASDLDGLVSGRVVISILAGTASATVRSAVGADARVVRAMPNLAAGIGQGVTAVAVGSGAAEADAALAERLFGAVGPLVVRIDESLMDAFTAVAGSGPAYVFYLAEAMVRAAVATGFTAEQADAVVRQTIVGAGALLRGDARSAAELRGAVTSRGGTTQAAIAVLDGRDVAGAIESAVVAARDRGRELGVNA